MNFRVVIAEDEAPARERLSEWVAAEEGYTIVGQCGDGREAVRLIRTEQPDLVFLDVRMPELDGFGVLQALTSDEIPVIIFVTAHAEFALRAFDAHAADYLLKPFTRERFRKALERACALSRNAERDVSLADLLATAKALGAGKPVDRIAIRSSGRIRFVKPEEIDWVQSDDNYSEIHVGKAVHLVRSTLVTLQEQLPRSAFARISRSTIVNAERVREIRPKTHGDYLVVLRDGTEVAGSRKYRDPLLRLLGKL